MMFLLWDVYPKWQALTHAKFKVKQLTNSMKQSTFSLKTHNSIPKAYQFNPSELLTQFALETKPFKLQVKRIHFQDNSNHDHRADLELIGSASNTLAFLLNISNFFLLTHFHFIKLGTSLHTDVSIIGKKILKSKKLASKSQAAFATIFCPIKAESLSEKPHQLLKEMSIYDMKLVGILQTSTKSKTAWFQLTKQSLVAITAGSVIGLEKGIVDTVMENGLQIQLPNHQKFFMKL